MTSVREQLALAKGYRAEGLSSFRDAGASENKTLPMHRWVPWIAGFSAQFVQDVIEEYLPADPRGECLILDPFAGVGTTLIEGLKAGSNVLGFEINAYAALAASAKLEALDLSPTMIREQTQAFVERMRVSEERIDRVWLEAGEPGLKELMAVAGPRVQQTYKSRIPFFSPPVELKVMSALHAMTSLTPGIQPLVKVALGATMVAVSNYSYEPSLSSRPGAGKPLVENGSLTQPLAQKLFEIVEDLEWAQAALPMSAWKRRRDVVLGSYFDSSLPQGSVSLVITSPPYMNNYHYVRNTRPQLHWLGLVTGTAQLKQYETGNFGKFWQTVRQGPPVELVPAHDHLRAELERLRDLRVEKGSYGGSGWANYVASYFNDCWRLVNLLEYQLAHGGTAVIVVGNSIIQGIEFKVDEVLADLAEAAGLTTEAISIVRTKRVGNSIIGSSVRNDNGEAQGGRLYDAAVILRKNS